MITRCLIVAWSCILLARSEGSFDKPDPRSEGSFGFQKQLTRTSEQFEQKSFERGYNFPQARNEESFFSKGPLEVTDQQSFQTNCETLPSSEHIIQESSPKLQANFLQYSSRTPIHLQPGIIQEKVETIPAKGAEFYSFSSRGSFPSQAATIIQKTSLSSPAFSYEGSIPQRPAVSSYKVSDLPFPSPAPIAYYDETKPISYKPPLTPQFTPFQRISNIPLTFSQLKTEILPSKKEFLYSYSAPSAPITTSFPIAPEVPLNPLPTTLLKTNSIPSKAFSFSYSVPLEPINALPATTTLPVKFTKIGEVRNETLLLKKFVPVTRISESLTEKVEPPKAFSYAFSAPLGPIKPAPVVPLAPALITKTSESLTEKVEPLKAFSYAFSAPLGPIKPAPVVPLAPALITKTSESLSEKTDSLNKFSYFHSEPLIPVNPIPSVPLAPTLLSRISKVPEITFQKFSYSSAPAPLLPAIVPKPVIKLPEEHSLFLQKTAILPSKTFSYSLTAPAFPAVAPVAIQKTSIPLLPSWQSPTNLKTIKEEKNQPSNISPKEELDCLQPAEESQPSSEPLEPYGALKMSQSENKLPLKQFSYSFNTPINPTKITKTVPQNYLLYHTSTKFGKPPQLFESSILPSVQFETSIKEDSFNKKVSQDASAKFNLDENRQRMEFLRAPGAVKDDSVVIEAAQNFDSLKSVSTETKKPFLIFVPSRPQEIRQEVFRPLQQPSWTTLVQQNIEPNPAIQRLDWQLQNSHQPWQSSQEAAQENSSVEDLEADCKGLDKLENNTPRGTFSEETYDRSQLLQRNQEGIFSGIPLEQEQEVTFRRAG